MRDIALTLVILPLLLWTFRQPAVGAYLWAWLSLMNPHKLTWGFAYSMPFAQASALVTLLTLALTKKRHPFPLTPVTVLQLALFGWMTLTCFFAWNLPEVVLERWVFVAKIQVMLFVTWMLLRGRLQVELLIWIVALSVGFYGIKGGLWTIATGGGGRVWGPPGGMIQDNNALAASLVMLVPLFAYLYQVQLRRWVRGALALAIVFIAFAILGSQSRGALLALLAMALFMGLKGTHPVRTTLALVLLLAVAIPFMPESWFERMETIQSYEAESSAMSRVYSWTTYWNAARDNPVTGVGFRADDDAIYERYAPTGPEFDIFAKKSWVAHSIYFQMLGEHGFVGLALFLVFFGVVWLRAGQLARRARKMPGFSDWVPKLMPMIQVSLIGYAVGGAFLSLAYFDLPYYIVCFVVLVEATMREGVPAPRAAAASAANTVSMQSEKSPTT
ncbi:MAG TPA: putative O-glycosylation ligase, exosortase A system-associated [Rubrivivax sp.]|nr:putative O-glycosylation ligase, exosortase A system-associated [Rubrivivax sp.]